MTTDPGETRVQRDCKMGSIFQSASCAPRTIRYAGIVGTNALKQRLLGRKK